MPPVVQDWPSRLKQLAWIAAFLAILAAALLPAILMSAQFQHTISIYEQVLLIAAATLVIQLLRRRSIWEVTGQLDRTWLAQLISGCGLGALLMLTPAFLLWATGMVHFEQAKTSLDAILGATLLMAGVAGAEELLFRGVLFQRLVAGLGAWPAQLIIAGLFTLTHLGNPGMTGATKLWASINIFMASLLFGAAFLRTRSLALPVGIHFMANITQGVLLGFGVSGSDEPSLLRPNLDHAPTILTGGQFGLEASLPGLFVLALLLILLPRIISSATSSTAT